MHRCVVGEVKVDPLEVLGVRPDAPCRTGAGAASRTSTGADGLTDDGESRAPRKPSQPHPMLLHAWPAQEQVPGLDLSELREAIAAADAARFLAAVHGPDIDDALQQVGAGIPMALEQRRQEAEPVALSVINRLTWRGGAGDRVLAEDLLAGLRREPLTGRVVPVDLEMLSTVLEGDPDLSTGGFLDLRTGQVYDEAATDPMMVGEDAAIDVEEEPDRWLRFNRTGSRDGWQDMAAFAERQHDAALRERLERAIEGKGAFSRFRDLVHSESLTEQWYAFSTDRQWAVPASSSLTMASVWADGHHTAVPRVSLTHRRGPRSAVLGGERSGCLLLCRTQRRFTIAATTRPLPVDRRRPRGRSGSVPGVPSEDYGHQPGLPHHPAVSQAVRRDRITSSPPGRDRGWCRGDRSMVTPIGWRSMRLCRGRACSVSFW